MVDFPLQLWHGEVDFPQGVARQLHYSGARGAAGTHQKGVSNYLYMCPISPTEILIFYGVESASLGGFGFSCKLSLYLSFSPPLSLI